MSITKFFPYPQYVLHRRETEIITCIASNALKILNTVQIGLLAGLNGLKNNVMNGNIRKLR